SIDLSADGRYVVFSANIGFSSRQQVLLRDRQLGTTEVVSLNSQGSPNGGNFARDPRISADGRFVLFSSDVAFAPGDSNGFDDSFVRDRLLGTTERVSIGTDGTQGDSFTFFGRLSRDEIGR